MCMHFVMCVCVCEERCRLWCGWHVWGVCMTWLVCMRFLMCVCEMQTIKNIPRLKEHLIKCSAPVSSGVVYWNHSKSVYRLRPLCWNLVDSEFPLFFSLLSRYHVDHDNLSNAPLQSLGVLSTENTGNWFIDFDPCVAFAVSRVSWHFLKYTKSDFPCVETRFSAGSRHCASVLQTQVPKLCTDLDRLSSTFWYWEHTANSLGKMIS